MIKLTFLGTSGAVPSAKRNHTAVLLNYKNENILVDCGEGTQRQFRKARLNPCRTTRLLITHWHGDHVLGIPGLLQTLAFSGYNKKLIIYGPRGTKSFMKKILETFAFRGELNFEVKEVSGKFFETDEFYLEAEKMTHGVPCNAYAFVKKGQRRIDKAKLKKSKLPPGPLLKKLKDGKDIVHKGKKYSAKSMTYSQDSKKVSFVFDTSMNKKIVPFVKDSDLFICESNFEADFEEKAGDYNHMTSKQVAGIAKKSKSKKLVLTHISQRYAKDNQKILKEAQKVFKNSHLVKDLDKVSL
ncbi:ribonuclease Z [Candidatus Pacearchaeota archaeon]|nr:ribonuclease Z [Candidatus Pacearchaeota archaeon]